MPPKSGAYRWSRRAVNESEANYSALFRIFSSLAPLILISHSLFSGRAAAIRRG